MKKLEIEPRQYYSDITAERIAEIKSEYTDTVQHPEAIAVLLRNAVSIAIKEGPGDERMPPAIDLSADDRLNGVRVLISQTVDDWKFDANLADVRGFALAFVAAVEEYTQIGDTLYYYIVDKLSEAIRAGCNA